MTIFRCTVSEKCQFIVANLRNFRLACHCSANIQYTLTILPAMFSMTDGSNTKKSQNIHIAKKLCLISLVSKGMLVATSDKATDRRKVYFMYQ